MRYEELRASQITEEVLDKVDQVRQGQRVAVPATSVEGMQGMGKTHMMHQIAERVRRTTDNAVVVSIPGGHLRAVYQSLPSELRHKASRIEMLKHINAQSGRDIPAETRTQIADLGQESDEAVVCKTAWALGETLADVSRAKPVAVFFDDQHEAPGEDWRDRWFTAPLLDKDSRVVTVNTSEKPCFYKLGSRYRDLEKHVALQPLNVEEIAAAYNVDSQVAGLYKKITNGIPYLVTELAAQVRTSRDVKWELEQRFPYYAKYAADVLISQNETIAMHPRLRATVDVLACMGWFDVGAVEFATNVVLKRTGDQVQVSAPWDHREMVLASYRWLDNNTKLIRYSDDTKLSRIDPVASPVLTQALQLNDPDTYDNVIDRALQIQQEYLEAFPKLDYKTGRISPRHIALKESVEMLKAKKR